MNKDLELLRFQTFPFAQMQNLHIIANENEIIFAVSNAFNYGVIIGKRMERKKRKT